VRALRLRVKALKKEQSALYEAIDNNEKLERFRRISAILVGNEAELAAAVERGDEEEPAQQEQKPQHYDAPTQDLITWFQAHRADLPQEQFPLHTGQTVTDPEKFYAALQADISYGPGNIRAQRGLLQQDLEAVKELTIRKAIEFSQRIDQEAQERGMTPWEILNEREAKQ
jgi:hypothetical protein